MSVKNKITLIEGGFSEYQILVSSAASQGTRWACVELQRILRVMTGVTIPIGIKFERIPKMGFYVKRCIVVGEHPHIKELGINIEWDKLGDEGYRIVTCGEDVIIAGSDNRGAMYGVFSFLEKYMGIRWFTSDTEHIPSRHKVEIPSELDEIHVPFLEYREPSFWEGCVDGAWCAHNRCNGHFNRIEDFQGGKNSYFPFVHSFDSLVPAEKYFDEHPEYFSEVNGVRIKENTQLCLTNDEVYEIALEKIKKWINEHPEATIVSVSQNDGYNPCTCEKCRRIDEHEGSHAGSLITFVNKIANVLSEEYPHISIDTLAYVYTRKAPEHIRPLPNVIIRLCDIECCFSHPLEECDAVVYPYDTDAWRPKEGFSEEIGRWAKIHNRLYVWNYVTNFAHPLMPFPNFRVIKPNIDFFIKNNVKGLFQQGALWYGGGGSMAELRNYVMAQLMWNPECDTDILIDEFLSGVYKSAAPFMRRYFDLIHRRIENMHLGIYDPADDTYANKELKREIDAEIDKMKKSGVPMQEICNYDIRMKTFRLTTEKLGFMTEEMIDEANELFDIMETVSDDENVLRSVRRERLGLRYIELHLEDSRTEEHRRRVDGFFEDLRSHGIVCVSENRALEKSYEMMHKGIMHLWDSEWFN